ncbi:U3 small nucleolar RNA-associated protein 25 [Lindgomyces ingoldianus]|uniref:U3 small nucleolar RNA-associated protein 25 n=1 Tax=Lindgomyces ingoldianus TaxID=673940 RepID=A0ACB6QXT0_9PLEO|nr:U3 small nucleolar RNA-associated protein 25 [Lindgomyces ingoldianus]KAF2471686.1 U3 small nucleolar RNA-associated protein 25 [Lindgomyces ingoldianus]
MAPFRGRGSFRGKGRGMGRGMGKGRGSGRERGRVRGDMRSRDGREGVFSTARVEEAVAEEHLDVPEFPESDNESVATSEYSAEDENLQPPASAFHSLLQSFHQVAAKDNPRRKRRKLNHISTLSEDKEYGQQEQHNADEAGEAEGDEGAEGDERLIEVQVGEIEDEDEGDASDPFEQHFAIVDEKDLARRLKAIEANAWMPEKVDVDGEGKCTLQVPGTEQKAASNLKAKTVRDVKLKSRLVSNAQNIIGQFSTLEQAIVPRIFDYHDVLFCGRTVQNAPRLRHITCLHALNHIFKTRDRVIKNNAKLSREPENESVEYRDQGFTRPKVLFLLETKQACVRVVNAITQLCEFEQQENKKRFLDSFSLEEDKFSDNKPEDFRELFEGNDENEFRIGLKFTRKTLKLYSKFYNSDIIIASTLGLRRAIESGDPKKKDYDFLSSIEIVIMDQADATLMQNWEHAEYVFSHLNLQPREAHGCDFSRVRNWYLDGHAANYRQTIVLSAYLTPKINALYNKAMKNISGRLKYTPIYPHGAISTLAHLSIPQTFTRFDSPAHTSDPDARFKFFQTTVLPAILQLPKPAKGGLGVILFIPSYLDFVRVRNSLVDSPLSYASISEYTDLTDIRKARSHFMSGRHSLLLYTGRAHHFHRYQIRGVKRVWFYGVPENPRFYEEVVGWIGKEIERGEVTMGMGAAVRVLFSRWDGLELERVVGSTRVGRMVREVGDVFDFV